MPSKRKLSSTSATDADDIAADINSPLDSVNDEDKEEEELGPQASEDLSGEEQHGFGEALKKVLQTRGDMLGKHTVGARRVAEEKQQERDKLKRTEERKLLQERGHVVPDMSTASYEKKLLKIATKGVVKLFNTVNQQRKLQEKEQEQEQKPVKGSEKLTKSKFLELLHSTPAPTIS